MCLNFYKSRKAAEQPKSLEETLAEALKEEAEKEAQRKAEREAKWKAEEDARHRRDNFLEEVDKFRTEKSLRLLVEKGAIQELAKKAVDRFKKYPTKRRGYKKII